MIKKYFRYAFVLPFMFLLSFFTLPSLVSAATITAASCSQTAVQTAINSAVSGDTVNVPAGNCTYTGTVNITKAISVIGAGPTATVINGSNATAFAINMSSAGNVRLSNMGFTGSGGYTQLETCMINLRGTLNYVRLDHLKFTNIARQSIYVGLWDTILTSPKILVDHIEYTNNVTSDYSQFMKINGVNSTWKLADRYGTDDFVFIEDSSFIWTNPTNNPNSGVTDTEHGVRMVVRHNTITNGGIQMHDTGSTQGAKGQRATEIYNNTITCTSAGCNSLVGIGVRGGAFLIHDNAFNNGFWVLAYPQIYRATVSAGFVGASCNGTPVGVCDTPNYYHCSGGDHRACGYPGDSVCSGIGSCITAAASTADCPAGYPYIPNIDGTGASGYACRNQTGFGMESANGQTQESSPVYWWNNTVGGTAYNWSSDISPWFLSNRDYCNHSPATACGVKAGWIYTPYAYPHPLQSGTTPPLTDTTAPTTPTGLTATAISSSQINLAWTASTDAVGVTGYKIYRGGTQIGTSATNNYSNTGLTASTAYSYTVSAYDAAGNTSAQSTSASATTQAAPPPPPAGSTPTFISEHETVWNSATTPKTTASFNVQTGDVLVAYGMSEMDTRAVSVSGGSLTWTQQQVVNVSGYGWLGLWTATANANTAITVSFTASGGSGEFGGNVLHFRNASIGSSAKTNSASGAPTLNLTTTAPNSSLVVANVDWTAKDGASRAWRTAAGTFSETSYYANVGVSYTIYGGYHANAGAIGTYAVGLTAPTAQKYAIAAIEIKTGSGGTTPPPSTTFAINDRVQVVNGPLNVRATANTAGTLLGSQPTGNLGTVIGGPTVQGGYNWWNVNYDNAPDGWSVEDYLVKYITPTTDTTAPTTPTSLTASAISSSAINLAWTASTDAVGVTGYKIYRGGTQIGTATTNSYSNTGLTASTAYTYTVAAYDAAGNNSAQSTSAGATTLAGGGTGGNTITAASCSQTAVQTAINSAANGDTVVVPAGSCTWSGGISIPDSKKLTLLGAGMGSTRITGGAFTLGMSGSRITGFGFSEGAINADGNDFRIDHCSLTFSTWTDGISIISRNLNPPVTPTGLIDNNQITNMRINVSGTNYMMSEGSEQNQTWTTPLDLGGPSAVYIEDNTFYPGSGSVNAVDGNYGGRYVFRYNTMNGLQIEAHSVQSENRAYRKWEVYGNIIDNTGSNVYYPFRIRGGTGMIFFNSVPGNWSNDGVAFDNIRDYDPVGIGLCNGTNAWDGNQGAFGYPCRDQIGRGGDATLWTNSPPGAYTQPLVPAYVWLNRTESNTELRVDRINDPNNYQHIQPNRDYYNYTSSFNGISGMGAGTLANRPTTCTVGVGYWATNQSTTNLTGMVGAHPTTPLSGTLYKCTATNTWTAYYTPYTYPHPLAGGTTPPPTDTTPPTVSMTAPAASATVSGISVAVSATASDNTAVSGVQFKLDGANLGTEDTTSPYSIVWDTTTATNASHTLTATARDAAGNTTTSASRTVTVSNVAPTPTASLTASPTSITSGQSSTLTWASTNATACLGTGFSTGGALSGTATVSPTANTTYALACTGGGTTVTSSATVSVTPASGGTTTPALVNYSKGMTGSSVSQFNISKSVATGNTIVIAVAVSNSATRFTVSAPGLDFQEDTYGTGGGSPFIELSYAVWSAYVPSGGTKTITVQTTAPDYIRWGATEFSGLASNNYLMDSSSNQGFSTSITTGPVTTGQGNTLLFGVVRTDGDETAHGGINIGTGFTGVWPFADAEPEQKLMTEYRIVGPGEYNGGFSLQAQDGGGWVAGLAAYTASGGGTPPPTDTTPPVVSLTAPAASATVSGTSVAVSATASDNTAVSGVQFKLDGANLGSEDTVSPYSITWDTTSATNASHTLTAVARDAAGNTTTSASRTVTVSNTPTAPTITTHPTNQTTSVGGTATFSAVAAGTAPLSYQWKKNGVNISGATSASYTTPTLALSDSGTAYSVTVSNSAGSVTSTSAILTVSTAVSPTFVGEYETVWNNGTSPKTTSTFSVQSGDVLVAYATVPEQTPSVSVSGGSLTWTQQQVVNVSGYDWLGLWTATVPANATMSVTFTASGANAFGGNVLQFRNASIGASSKTNVSSGAPTLNLTTTQANSAIVVANSDWSAKDGAARVWRTNAGAFTETTYYRDTTHYAVYGGYHANAGAIGTYAVGLSAPTGQKYSLAAIEIKTGSGGTTPPPSTTFAVNDRVQVVNGPLNVRATANTAGTLLGSQATNALGTVIAGPTVQGGYTWWNVNYDSAPDGWSVENYLIKYVAPIQYNITVTQGTNGTIAPGTTAVNQGASQTFTITPNTGYRINTVTVDGTNQGAIATYTFTNVTGGHTITASFASTADVTAPSVPTNLTATAISSSQINLSWTASTDAVGVIGYKIFRAGIQIGTATANSFSNTGLTASTAYSYTVSAYDAAGNNSAPSTSASATTQAGTVTTYAITVTQGSNGTISPNTATVNQGANQTFTIVPNSGYQIASVTVDGTSQGTVSSYTFTNVIATHTITASFSIIVNTGSISLFTTQTPAQTDADGRTYELGTKFKSNIAGQITAVRFWKAVGEVGTHTGRIWSSTGTLLASVAFTGETASGWQVQNLATPLTISANTTYVVSVNTGTNYLYANTVSGLTSVITNGNLSTIVGTNGVYGNTGTFPTTAWNSSNYFRDVVFQSQASTFPITVTQGSNGTITPGTTSVNQGSSQTFTIVPNSGYQIASVTVDGTSQGTVSSYTFTNVTGAHTITATFVPLTYAITVTQGENGVIAPGTTNVTNGANQIFTITPNSGYQIASVTVDGTSQGSISSYTFTNVTAIHSITASFVAVPTFSLFTTQTPAQTDADGRTYELGTKFKSNIAGQITAVRFWKAVGEVGTHTGRIWSSTGTLLASVAFTGETASGWQVQNLATPLTISANTTYVVSVNTGTNYLYANTVSGLTSVITNGNLSTIVGTNGVYGNTGTFPTTAWNSSNYFRDVVFQPGVVATTAGKSLLTKELFKGSTGEDVSILQRFLSAFDHVYPEKIVSGYYGSMTAAAVSAFQKAHGISPVGRVGPMTLKKLNELLMGR